MNIEERNSTELFYRCDGDRLSVADILAMATDLRRRKAPASGLVILTGKRTLLIQFTH